MDERGAILAVATGPPERGLTGRPGSCCRQQLRPSAKQLVMRRARIVRNQCFDLMRRRRCVDSAGFGVQLKKGAADQDVIFSRDPLEFERRLGWPRFSSKPTMAPFQYVGWTVALSTPWPKVDASPSRAALGRGRVRTRRGVSGLGAGPQLSTDATRVFGALGLDAPPAHGPSTRMVGTAGSRLEQAAG
jgi:hypothetical protein